MTCDSDRFAQRLNADHRWNQSVDREAQRRWPDSSHGVLSSAVASQRHMARLGFSEGTAWQREQLRTVEMVERVAERLCLLERFETLSEHTRRCQREDCRLVVTFRNDARDLIDMLLGAPS